MIGGETQEKKEINQKLEKVGVVRLTPKDVQERFGNLKGPETRMEAPTTDNVDWYLQTGTYTYNKKVYMLNKLRAKPTGKDSSLKQKGFIELEAGGIEAGSTNFLSALAESGVYLQGTPSYILTVLQAIQAFGKGAKKETIIKNIEIIYSRAHFTEASFIYVRDKGLSEDYQELSFISTKGETSVGYLCPQFDAENGNISVRQIHGEKSLKIIPEGYDSSKNAIEAYLNPNAGSRATIKRISITGIEDKKVFDIYPVDSAFPAHIY